ncbi:MAG: RNase P subunit p30 family protein [Candidatus Nanohaloarchaea archaeon]
MSYHDLCLRDTNEGMKELGKELGWSEESLELERVFLEAEDWGELKRKIGERREEADVLIFCGGDETLNRKAASDSRMDVLLHPEKGRKDSGINHVIAREASDNGVAIGFDFSMMKASRKKRSHITRHWSKNLMLCGKYDAPFIITSGADEKWKMRAPEDLAPVLNSLNDSIEGMEAVKENPGKIIERSRERESEDFVRPGEKIRGGEE